MYVRKIDKIKTIWWLKENGEWEPHHLNSKGELIEGMDRAKSSRVVSALDHKPKNIPKEKRKRVTKSEKSDRVRKFMADKNSFSQTDVAYNNIRNPMLCMVNNFNPNPVINNFSNIQFMSNQFHGIGPAAINTNNNVIPKVNNFYNWQNTTNATEEIEETSSLPKVIDEKDSFTSYFILDNLGITESQTSNTEKSPVLSCDAEIKQAFVCFSIA